MVEPGLRPECRHLPLVLLATVATVIASQAVITGAYSITRQAMQLGFLYEYGFLILMGLLVTGVLWTLIGPPYYVILSWLR